MNTQSNEDKEQQNREIAEAIKTKRMELGMTIESFWAKLGVSKSGGSRYESCNRHVPKPVQRLFQVTYQSKQDTDALSKFGDEGKKLLELLDDKEFSDAILQRLLNKKRR